MSQGEVFGQILGSVVLAGVLVAAVNGWLNRKKLGADAVKSITDAAGSVVSNVQADNARLRAENEELRDTNEILVDAEIAWRDERRDTHDRVRQLRRWIADTLARVRAVDPDWPDPPDVLPPEDAAGASGRGAG